jgi:hypothetical protein
VVVIREFLAGWILFPVQEVHPAAFQAIMLLAPTAREGRKRYTFGVSPKEQPPNCPPG